jgi:hypothetical protein
MPPGLFPGAESAPSPAARREKTERVDCVLSLSFPTYSAEKGECRGRPWAALLPAWRGAIGPGRRGWRKAGGRQRAVASRGSAYRSRLWMLAWCC